MNTESIIKVFGIGLCGALAALLLRRVRPEMAFAVSAATVCLCLALCLPVAGQIINSVTSIAAQSGVEPQYITVMLKITAISWLTSAAKDVCADAGEKAIAEKISLCSKVLIVAVAMPAVIGAAQEIMRAANGG